MWFWAWDFTDDPTCLRGSGMHPAYCMHAYPVFTAFPTGLTELKRCAKCNTTPSPATVDMFERGGKAKVRASESSTSNL